MMKTKTAIATIDFLWALVAFLVIITAILFAANHDLSKGNIVDKAEFVAILEWPESNTSDLDLWVRNPMNNTIYFRNRDEGLVTLDHDDTGGTYNIVIGPEGKKIESSLRREVASIRGIIPGKFIIDTMLYKLDGITPVPAKVQVIKLNPYQVIAEKNIILKTKGEDQTIVSFNVNPDGSVSEIDTDTQYNLSQQFITHTQ